MSCPGHENFVWITEGSGLEYGAGFEVCVKISLTKLLRMAVVVSGARKKEVAASFEVCMKMSFTKLFRMADLISGARKNT